MSVALKFAIQHSREQLLKLKTEQVELKRQLRDEKHAMKSLQEKRDEISAFNSRILCSIQNRSPMSTTHIVSLYTERHTLKEIIRSKKMRQLDELIEIAEAIKQTL